jgi:hypothetical protein
MSLEFHKNTMSTYKFFCPSFLRHKARAKYKPNHLLTTEDVGLVVNISPVNDHLKVS